MGNNHCDDHSRIERELGELQAGLKPVASAITDLSKRMNENEKKTARLMGIVGIILAAIQIGSRLIPAVGQ